MTATTNQPNETRLDITVSASRVPRCSLMLQSGFQVRAQVGVSVRDLLCNQLELPSDYLDSRIQSVFLDSRPVDDMDRAIVEDGSVLALSGALPGLVGATMRRGGYYGCLRDSITYRPASANLVANPKSAAGTITIKLFNLVLKDLGPHFLSRGVLLPANAVEGFLRSQPGDIWDANSRFRINGELLAVSSPAQHPWPRLAGTLLLRVTADADD
ncbi:MAG TPA: hypothetical protein DCZ69_11480 [Syntrophobacteraceae bacterium]|nr:hypothetical protein [Syntrophobacteraceae bacterium]